MRIKVPPMVELSYPHVGMYGLGQDPTGDTPIDDNTIVTGSGTDPGSSVLIPTFQGTTPIVTTTQTPQPGYTGGGAQTVSTPNGDYQIVNGTVFDPNGNVVSLSSLQNALGFPNSGTTGASPGAPTLAQILAAAAQATGTAVTTLARLQGPSVIPGANLVYNPATGQLSNASGVGTIGQIGALGTINWMPILLIAGGFILVMSMSKR